MTDFHWYISSDEETYYKIAAQTREEAVEAGREEYGGEEFYIAEAKPQEFPYHLMFNLNWMFESVMENGEDYWGEDQEGPFVKQPTGEQEKDLKAMLIEATKAWVEKHDIKLTEPWAFGAMRNEEKIEETRHDQQDS